MDEASKLVSELQSKLTELDHKVWKYQRDIASEFEKYAKELLRHVPRDVSETVSKAIAESIKDYTSLNSDAASYIESCATGNSFLLNGIGNAQSSTILAPSRRQEPEGEMARSSHEREQEFQGLFTPSYLPLLDSTSRHECRSSYDQPASSLLGIQGKEKEMDILAVDVSTDTRSLEPSPAFTRPATPKRRNTDNSLSQGSVDGTVRRSALRRYSSDVKPQSPRQVRFELAGEEVLPTSSPDASQSMLTDIPPSSISSDSDDEAGSEQVEDIDKLPPPKRISSTQALRALSRGPFEDDGTKWTTVSVDSLSEDLKVKSADSLHELERAVAIPVAGGSGKGIPTDTLSNANVANVKDQDETPSDDEMLDMPPLKPMKGQNLASILSPVNPVNIDDNKSPTASTRSPGTGWQGLKRFSEEQESNDKGMYFTEEDQDELFHFDENTDERSSPPEEQEYSDPESPVEKEPLNLSSYSRSPARAIMKPILPGPAPAPASSSKGIIGSFKGHPFNMPIVSDEIHAQAASLGALNSFVGSVNGRSGLDESDVQSFRASGGVGSFSGTPRSMSERMMVEDLMEADEARNN